MARSSDEEGDETRCFVRCVLRLLCRSRGDLGPFWAGEMAWQEAEQTLVIGPVPVTDPAYPIALRVRFEDVVLSAVEAQMPSGDRYLFSAAPQ